jgi:hypothetical protein
MSSRYTDKKFYEVVEKTGLGSSTINGLYEHLVNGLKNVEASEKAGILPAQLTRGLRTFEDKVSELNQLKREKEEQKLVTNLDDATKSIYLKQSLIKSNDVNEARELVGKNTSFVDAEAPNSYSGTIVYIGHSNVFQQCGTNCVIHASGNLSKLPQINEVVSIEYSNTKKLASVQSQIENSKSISR